jgi:orotidine-5'-phosphate decarboxylase
MSNITPHANAKAIIVALDFDDKNQALELVNKLDPNLCRLKVGKEMFTLFGPDWVKQLIGMGFDIFLDLKFHDIPNTVAKACAAAAKLGVWMVNVHASGGAEMMKAAREAIEPFGAKRPLITAVTVLTSMDAKGFDGLGYKKDIQKQVIHFAELAKLSGMDGVVCSALEAEFLSSKFGKEFKLVTPGIRPEGSAVGDQSRVMTPVKALQAGASYLVIGRPITQSEDPLAALCDISESIAFS